MEEISLTIINMIFLAIINIIPPIMVFIDF